VRRDIAPAARIPVLVPRAAHLGVLFAYDVRVVGESGAQRADHIYHAGSGADGDDSQVPCGSEGLLDDFVDFVAAGARCICCI